MQTPNFEHFLGLEELTKGEILNLFSLAKKFKLSNKKHSLLNGKTVVNLFCEPSTRTRTSFEIAAKRLSADVVNLNPDASSFLKGESLKDTINNLCAMQVAAIVVRHKVSGIPYLISRYAKAAIINAGDGAHEHPTQGLLDTFTLYERFGDLKSLNVTIVGDIAFSRTARSNIWALKKLGANVTVCGPKTLIPSGIEKMGVKVTYNIKDAIKNADVLNVLRIQLERQEQKFFPSLNEYATYFGVTQNLLDKHGKEKILIMHPGPINRNIELSDEVADSPNSVILEQVTNGVFIRMAVLVSSVCAK